MNESYIVNPGTDVRALENPNIPLGSPEVFQQVFGEWRTDSGETITAQRALNFAPVWQAVSLISGDVAKLPLNVYQRRTDLGERGRERADSHPAQRLIRHQANEQMSAHKFWRRLMIQALLWSNSYALIDRDPVSGIPLGLYPLLPDRTAPELQRDGSMLYVTEAGGRLTGYRASDVLHIENMSITGEADCELVLKARNSFALGLAAERFASKFYKNGARIGGILEVPVGMTKQASDNLEQGFRKTYDGADQAFKTIVLRDGARFHAAQQSPQESQMIEARVEQVRDVARWYNLPPHKLGDDARTSYASLEQENRSYLDSCLSSWLAIIAAECWMKLLASPEKQANTHYVEHNTAALIAADIKTQYEIANIGIQSGILSPNEFRATQNLNPRVDGLGDKYIMPLNMTYTDQADQPAEVEDVEPVAELDEAQPAETVLAASDRLVTSSRAVTVDAASAVASYVTREVRRQAKQKTATRFVTWFDDRFSDLATESEKRLHVVADLVAGLSDSQPGAIRNTLVSHVVLAFGEQVNDLLQTTSEAELLDAISVECDRFRSIAGEIAGSLFDDFLKGDDDETLSE